MIGCDLWSDADGFVEAVQAVGITGICGSGIIEVIAEMYLTGIISADGVVDGSLAERSSRVVVDGRTYAYRLREGEIDLSITQNDVRAIQLAKAALYAGVRLLMDRMAIDAVDRIRLAGAFGSNIDVKYAMILGLIPDCDLRHVTSAGNAAGTGARIALLDRNTRPEIEHVVGTIEKVETAVEPRFQQHFVEAMAIPHKIAKYPHLSQHVNLPVRLVADASAATKRLGSAAGAAQATPNSGSLSTRCRSRPVVCRYGVDTIAHRRRQASLSPDISRRRTVEQEYYQDLNRLACVLEYGACTQFVLFGIRKNRASYSSRSSLIHSYGYESSDDRTDYLARFPLKSEPFMNYPG